MRLDQATVLVTGANRGIGRAFVRAVQARGARKVYAAVRDPARLDLPGVEAVTLDVTRDDQVAQAAQRCGDVDLLINNAGIAELLGVLSPEAIDAARRQFEVNVLGPWRLARAFAPILAARGGGAILNVVSVASWISSPQLGVYGTSKAAAWSLTNGLRQALRAQGTQVLAMHMGFVDTDMTQGIDFPKSTPDEVVARALDALEAGASEVLADALTQQVKQGLSADPAIYMTDR